MRQNTRRMTLLGISTSVLVAWYTLLILSVALFVFFGLDLFVHRVDFFGEQGQFFF